MQIRRWLMTMEALPEIDSPTFHYRLWLTDLDHAAAPAIMFRTVDDLFAALQAHVGHALPPASRSDVDADAPTPSAPDPDQA